jgi:UPF0716 family protein affecting phage T7 exclusion
MNLGHWRDLVLMALRGLVGFTGAGAEGPQTHRRGRRRHNHGALPAMVAALGVIFAGERMAMPLAVLDVPNFDPRTVAMETWLLRT